MKRFTLLFIILVQFLLIGCGDDSAEDREVYEANRAYEAEERAQQLEWDAEERAYEAEERAQQRAWDAEERAEEINQRLDEIEGRLH